MTYEIGTIAMIGGGIIDATELIPITLGFGTVEIVTGNVDAVIQSSIGAVNTRSTFATMTYLGMTGVFSSLATVGTGITGIGDAIGTLIP